MVPTRGQLALAIQGLPFDIHTLRAPGYNSPDHLAMFLSQWLHQLFLWNKLSFDEYKELQSSVYAILDVPKEGDYLTELGG